MPHYVASDLGLHCFPNSMTLLRVSRYERVKLTHFANYLLICRNILRLPISAVFYGHNGTTYTENQEIVSYFTQVLYFEDMVSSFAFMQHTAVVFVCFGELQHFLFDLIQVI